MARREQQTFGTIELQSGGGNQAGKVQFDPVDVSGGSTTLKLTSTQAVTAIGTWNVSHKLIININGTEYYLPLDIVSAWSASPNPNDIACSTAIEDSVMTPIRLMAASNVAATTSIGTSTLGIPLHGMGTDSMSSLSSVGTITLTPIRVLSEADVASAGSAVGTPTAVRVAVPLPDAVASATSVGTCTLTPIRVFAVNDIASEGSRIRKHDEVVDITPIRVFSGSAITATTSVGESTLGVPLHDMGTENIVSGVSYVGYPQVTT